MRGVFLDRRSLDRDDLDLSGFETLVGSWKNYEVTGEKDIALRLRDADIVVTNKVVLDKTVLASAHGLKLICIAATGTNNVDLDAAREAGIAVCNVVRYATPSVVQHTFALILSLTRRLAEHQQAISRGDWQRSEQFCLLDYPMRELNGLTLGIIGYGELGKAVADAAKCFGLNVIIAQRPGNKGTETDRVELDTLLSEVDIISLHCPLADNTRNLIGARELGLMKKDALLINTARGGIVDEAALAQAITENRIGGAGVDVLAEEPPVHDSPLLDIHSPRLLLTPHVAWASRSARQRLIDEVVRNIHSFLNGDRRNRIV
ncbi:MAG: 2-hydroxyacid dehydrogenase [Gammaproteobacteria bacterium]|nr:2-hydroxyacid dehydrogenase [Gammaproteobacteria bacterium]